jgi:hypothetical protein
MMPWLAGMPDQGRARFHFSRSSSGRDMKSTYKETSRGGLAVNVVEC